MRFNRSEAPSHRIRTLFEFCNNPCIYTFTSTNLARFTIVKRRLFEKRVFWHHCLRSKVRRPCRKVWEIEWLTQECELRRSIATCTKCHSFSTVGLLTRVLEDGFYVWPATLGEWLASVCVLFNVRWWDSLGLVGTLSLSPEKENLGLERREERTGLCRPHQDQARPNHKGPKLHNSENIPTPLELWVSYLFWTCICLSFFFTVGLLDKRYVSSC